MTDAESKIKTDVKRKRIRHAYPRKEVYHRWIHSPEYVCASRNHQISGRENYLRIGDIGKDRSIRLIESLVDCGCSVFAVIDRDANRILYRINSLSLLQNYFELFRMSMKYLDVMVIFLVMIFYLKKILNFFVKFILNML